MPTVSVIVPNYNHAPYLKQRIDSILAQTYQDFELILLDDCSTDSSREVLESYRSNPHVSHIIYNGNNSGSAFRQWDKGITLAKGEWIWIAESDDYATPYFLETLETLSQRNTDCGLIYSWSYRVDKEGKKLWEVPDLGNYRLYNGNDFICNRLLLSNIIVNVSSCIFRRKLFRPECTGLYEHMRLCGDWLFYVLLCEQSHVIEVCSPLNHCRRHETNISENAEAKGLTFLEGADVLEYILQHHKIKPSHYARSWGRLWAKYRIQWKFTKSTNKAISQRLYPNHKLIVFYYWIYRIRLLIYKWQK